MALSNKDKQRQYRERQSAEGLTEVRGIYAKPEEHGRIKRYAKKLKSKKQAENEKQ